MLKREGILNKVFCGGAPLFLQTRTAMDFRRFRKIIRFAVHGNRVGFRGTAGPLGALPGRSVRVYKTLSPSYTHVFPHEGVYRGGVLGGFSAPYGYGEP